MSRTFRKASNSARKYLGKDYVRDGTFTHVSKSCQNNGSCSWCRENRTHKMKYHQSAHLA